MTEKDKFHKDMKNIYFQCSRLNYEPKIFLGMVNNYGGFEAAKRLIAQKDYMTYGFATLWEKNRLDLTMEALIVEKWSHLFSPKELDECKKRLSEVGYTFQ